MVGYGTSHAHTMLYIKNSWIQKGIEVMVSTYHIELEEPQDRPFCHGFVKIGNLVIDALKNCMILN